MKKIWMMFAFLLYFNSFFAVMMEINTKYFRIKYDKKLTFHAENLYKVADEIAEREYNFYRYEPESKTVILILDNEIENSFVTPDFGKAIVLFPNIIDKQFFEMNYDNWMNFVFSHELSHHIIMQKYGFTLNFWMHEGLAVYMESRYINGGRGNSSIFNMKTKAEAYEDKFSGLSLTYNGSSNCYTHGASFIKFISEKYGEDKLVDALEVSVFEQPMHSEIGYLGKLAFLLGVTGDQLIKEWKEYIIANTFIPKNIVEGTALLDPKKGLYVKNKFKLNNGKLYFNNFKDDGTPKPDNYVYEYDICAKKLKCIKNVSDADLIDIYIEPNGKITYYTSVLRGESLNSEVTLHFPYFKRFLFENSRAMEKGKEAILNFLKTDEDTYFVKRTLGLERLESKNKGILIPEADLYFFGKLFYESGKLYFDAKKEGEDRKCIFVYDLSTKKIQKLVQGNEPFVKDGNLYFCNSQNGTSNIFNMRLNSGAIHQLTDVKFGAFSPIFNNGTLYYLNYSSNGFEIFMLNEKEFLNSSVKFNYETQIKPQIKSDKNIVNFSPKIAKNRLVFRNFEEMFINSALSLFNKIPIVGVVDENRKQLFEILLYPIDFMAKALDSNFWPAVGLSYKYLNYLTVSVRFEKYKNKGKTEEKDKIKNHLEICSEANLPLYIQTFDAYLIPSIGTEIDFIENPKFSISYGAALKKSKNEMGLIQHVSNIKYIEDSYVEVKRPTMPKIDTDVFLNLKYIEILFRFSNVNLMSNLFFNLPKKNLITNDNLGKSFVFLKPKYNYAIPINKGTSRGDFIVKNIFLIQKIYILKSLENAKGALFAKSSIALENILIGIIPLGVEAGFLLHKNGVSPHFQLFSKLSL